MKRMFILLAVAAAAPIMGMDVDHAKLPSHALDGPSERLRALKKQADDSYKGFQAAQHYYEACSKFLHCSNVVKMPSKNVMRLFECIMQHPPHWSASSLSKHGRCL